MFIRFDLIVLYWFLMYTGRIVNENFGIAVYKHAMCNRQPIQACIRGRSDANTNCIRASRSLNYIYKMSIFPWMVNGKWFCIKYIRTYLQCRRSIIRLDHSVICTMYINKHKIPLSLEFLNIVWNMLYNMNTRTHDNDVNQSKRMQHFACPYLLCQFVFSVFGHGV